MSVIADPKHPLWIAVRMLSIAVVLGLLLTFNYNQFDARDITTIVLAMLASGGFDLGKKIVTDEPKQKNPEVPEVVEVKIISTDEVQIETHTS